jgi:hypothetical protein
MYFSKSEKGFYFKLFRLLLLDKQTILQGKRILIVKLNMSKRKKLRNAVKEFEAQESLKQENSSNESSESEEELPKKSIFNQFAYEFSYSF